MKYKIRVLKQIHGCFATVSTEDTYLKKDIELPFVPQIGMYLRITDDIDVEVKDFSYDCIKQTFKIYATEDTTFGNLHQNTDKLDYNKHVDEYIKYGWEFEKKGQRYERGGLNRNFPVSLMGEKS
jgi:hypothetical protein